MPIFSAPWLRARAHALAAGGVCFALYCFTATRTIGGGDTAEFALVAARGGVAHPPGYPLHNILAQIFAHFPISTIPFRVSLLSSLACAATVTLLAHLFGYITTSRWIATSVAMAFGLSPVCWSLAGQPEVFPLGLFLATGIVHLAMRCSFPTTARRPVRTALELGLWFGLGLANHHTVVLLAPAGVFILWRNSQGASVLWKSLLRGVAVALIGLTIGLLPYAALVRQSDSRIWAWGDTGSVAGLVRHFLRADFGTFSLGLSKSRLDPLRHAGAFLEAMGTQSVFLFGLAALIGIVVALRRQPLLAGTLVACLALAGPVFVVRFNLPDSDLAAAIRERFFLMPLMLVFVMAVWGIEFLSRYVSSPVLRIVLPLAVAVAAVRSFPNANHSGDRFVEASLRVSLQNAEPNAVILGQGDASAFGYAYLRHVEGIRPDVRYVDIRLLPYRWYHARAHAEVPELSLRHDPSKAPLFTAVSQLMRRVPTYVIAEVRPLLPPQATYPDGLLYRVLPPEEPFPELADLSRRLQRALAQLPIEDAPADAWSRYFRTQAADAADSIANAHLKLGEAAESSAFAAVSGVLRGTDR
ncbi:MAG: DUF2723 domain-containing protein [Deltaproteobacteria bacterium]|nr:DUF2723 domain-containing protein [Deltaproteobacteria bacterium]